MNKTVLYAVIFVVLAVAVGLFVKGQSGNTFGNSENNFASRKKQSEIHRIFIGDRDNNKIELIKQPNGTWELNGKYKARQTAVDLLLGNQPKKLMYLYILPDAAKQGVYRELRRKRSFSSLF